MPNRSITIESFKGVGGGVGAGTGAGIWVGVGARFQGNNFYREKVVAIN